MTRLLQHAIDTRPLRIRPYRNLLIGQGAAFPFWDYDSSAAPAPLTLAVGNQISATP